MKEKADFVANHNIGLRDQLASLEADLTSQRDMLTTLKKRRDDMRVTGARLKDTCTYVTNPLLLADLVVSSVW